MYCFSVTLKKTRRGCSWADAFCGAEYLLRGSFFCTDNGRPSRLYATASDIRCAYESRSWTPSGKRARGGTSRLLGRWRASIRLLLAASSLSGRLKATTHAMRTVRRGRAGLQTLLQRTFSSMRAALCSTAAPASLPLPCLHKDLRGAAAWRKRIRRRRAALPLGARDGGVERRTALRGGILSCGGAGKAARRGQTLITAALRPRTAISVPAALSRLRGAACADDVTPGGGRRDGGTTAMR